MNSPYTPSLSLLVKLGSIAVHVDELLSPMGHTFDRIALRQLLEDQEVAAWLKDFDKEGLLPKKRN